jgi:hypothetical protein
MDLHTLYVDQYAIYIQSMCFAYNKDRYVNVIIQLYCYLYMYMYTMPRLLLPPVLCMVRECHATMLFEMYSLFVFRGTRFVPFLA